MSTLQQDPNFYRREMINFSAPFGLFCLQIVNATIYSSKTSLSFQHPISCDLRSQSKIGIMFTRLLSSSCRHQLPRRYGRWLTSASEVATSSSGVFDKLTFIGTGKMAQAMIDPLITNGYQPAEKVTVYDVSTKSMEDIQSRFPNIKTSESIAEAVHDAECIVLAVKPQNISEAFWKEFPGIEGNGSEFNLREDATLVSILAGTPVKDFAPSGISKIVRGYVIEFVCSSFIFALGGVLCLVSSSFLLTNYLSFFLAPKYAQYTIYDRRRNDGMVLHSQFINLRSERYFKAAQLVWKGYIR